jgi:hypothetical protein
MEVSVKLNIFWRCTSAVSTLPQCYLFDAIRSFAATTRCILRKKARLPVLEVCKGISRA